MIVDKREVISIFESEFAAWERLLAALSPAQINEPWLGDGLSVKDTIVHLAAWQQRTSIQLEAALHDREPHDPAWPVALDVDESSDAVDQANAWIVETNRGRTWSEVHHEWRDGFVRFLELVRAMPEADLLPAGKLAWMADYEPSEVLPGWYDHHHSEHRGLLHIRMREHFNDDAS